jgi:methyl-accepting chemotaxis protein
MSLDNLLPSSFKGKIILLSAFGVFAVCLVAGTNKYFDLSRKKAIEIGKKSQEISDHILEEEMLVGKFIHSGKESLLKKNKNIQEQLKQHFVEVRKVTSDSDIIKILAGVEKNQQNFADIFNRISATITVIKEEKIKLTTEMSRINELIISFNGLINQEETDLAMEGEVLSPNKAALRQMTRNLVLVNQQQLINIQGIFVNGNAEKFISARDNTNKKIVNVSNNIDTLLDKDSGASYQEIWQQIVTSMQTVDGKVDLLFNKWQKNRELEIKLEKSSNQAMAAAREIAAFSGHKVEENSKTAELAGIIISLVSLLVLVGLSFVVVRNILSLLGGEPQIMADIAQEISQGNLAVDFVDGRKAAGLYLSMKQMSENLRQTMQEVADSSGGVADSSDKLSSVAGNMTNAADNLTREMGNTVTTTEEINANIQSVVATAEDMAGKAGDSSRASAGMADNVNTLASAIEEMSASVREVGQSCLEAQKIAENAKNKSDSSSAMIAELNQAAQDVGNVISVIGEITEQTKLLALNATIEAARAGEAGKGFAVVANEVKDLAAQTAKATGDISQQIKEMQERTGQVVAAITAISTLNDEVNKVNANIASAVEEQNVTIGEITQTVSGTADAASSVSQDISALAQDLEEQVVVNVQSAATGVEEILNNTQRTSQVAEDTAKGATVVSETAMELSGLAERLQEQVTKFKLQS